MLQSPCESRLRSLTMLMTSRLPTLTAVRNRVMGIRCPVRITSACRAAVLFTTRTMATVWRPMSNTASPATKDHNLLDTRNIKRPTIQPVLYDPEVFRLARPSIVFLNDVNKIVFLVEKVSFSILLECINKWMEQLGSVTDGTGNTSRHLIWFLILPSSQSF